MPYTIGEAAKMLMNGTLNAIAFDFDRTITTGWHDATFCESNNPVLPPGIVGNEMPQGCVATHLLNNSDYLKAYTRPGVAEFVKFLRTHNIKVGIASRSDDGYATFYSKSDIEWSRKETNTPGYQLWGEPHEGGSDSIKKWLKNAGVYYDSDNLIFDSNNIVASSQLNPKHEHLQKLGFSLEKTLLIDDNPNNCRSVTHALQLPASNKNISLQNNHFFTKLLEACQTAVVHSPPRMATILPPGFTTLTSMTTTIPPGFTT